MAFVKNTKGVKLNSMLKSLNLTIFFCSTLFFLISVSAQVQASINNLSLTSLSVDDGLSQSSSNSAIQDSAGFMWIGTNNGLNIYDGYTFKTLKGPEGDFDAFQIEVLLQDSDGRIWFNVYNKGLYTYDPKKNRYQLVVSQSEIGKRNYISDVVETNENFWISSSKKLFNYDRTQNKMAVELDFTTEMAGENNDDIQQVVIKGDYLYLATDKGVFLYHTILKKRKKLPETNTGTGNQGIAALQESKVYRLHIENNNLYIATFINLQLLDISNIDRFFNEDELLPAYKLINDSLSIWDFYKDGELLYIASNQGFYVLNLKNNEIKHLFGYMKLFEQASDNIVLSIFKDKNGLFWLGSYDLGVTLWDPSAELITNYRYNNKTELSLSYSGVWSILPHHKEKDFFWVATTNGLNLVDDKNQTIKSYLAVDEATDFYGESHIYHMVYYGKDHLLLGTYDGIKVFNISTQQLVPYDYSEEINQLLKKPATNIYVDDNNILWLADDTSIYKIDLQHLTLKKVFDATINPIYNDPNEDITNLLGFLPNSPLLLFSNHQSLWAYNQVTDKVEQLYKLPKGNKSEFSNIDNWVVDKKNTLWLTFASHGLIGLSLTDFSVKYHYTSRNSTINDNIYSLQLDESGDFWFSSHNGIYMMDSETHHFRNFGVKEGIVNKEFNTGNKLRNNKLVYGGMAGVSVFEPMKLKALNSVKNFTVKVTNINVLSREINLPTIINTDKIIYLDYDDVGIKVNFSTFTYTNSENVRFEYKLIGSDDVTYPLTYEHSITFPTLPSGKHVLEVRALSPISGEFSKPVRVKFSVSYAPWASPFAYFLYLVLSVFIVGCWLYKRKQQNEILLVAHEEVKFREKRLQLALIGSNSDVWDWQAYNNLMFANRAVKDLELIEYTESYPFDEHINLIHCEDKNNFVSQWEEFIKEAKSENTFNCTYRLKSKNGEWLWYKDVGKIVEFSLTGLPSRVTGSYTNITQNKAAEERALYYGDAFKNTQDWVFIISHNFTRVTANKALCEVFGWKDEEFSFSQALFGFNQLQKKHYQRLFLSLKEGEHWKGEDVIKTDNHEKYHVILNITVSRNTTNNQLHYVCVCTDITAQKSAEKKLWYSANYDFLTDLPNRSLLLERIESAMIYSLKKRTSIALFFIDLDRFKQINDSLGHDHGDLLLQEVTKRLISILRPKDTIARIGGDEFVVLLEYFEGHAQLSTIAQKILTTLEQPVTLKSNVVSIGASIGIALYPNDASNSDELLHNADVAMYYSKQMGRNTFQFFKEQMNLETNSKLTLESKLKQGIHHNELINYYQPIFNQTEMKTIGLELLLRWQRGSEIISPHIFIPIAEELGLIIDITEQAVIRGLNNLVEWRKIDKELFLSINISPLHFVKNNLFPFIKEQLTKFNLPPSAIKLEVTESALIADPKMAIKVMNALSDLGILIALDDFGTGYSSLSYLKQLPLHIIKIDRAFVAGIGINDTDEAIVDATIVLAKRLNMKCIAEGVETKEQLNYLTKRQCYNIQGFLYSRPMDEASTKEYLCKPSIKT